MYIHAHRRVVAAICFALLILNTAGRVTASAQVDSAITIKVTDITGARISGAAIIMTSGSQKRELATGPDGSVLVDGLAQGTWVISVVKQGFAAAADTLVVSAQPGEVTVILHVAGVEETVQVQGTSTANAIQLNRQATGGTLLDIPVRELPASLSVVTQDVMQDRGVRTAMEAVENTVGMTARLGVGSSPSFSSRGFAGLRDVAVLRDGMRFDRSSTADTRPSDSFLLDRVEVLKGASSLLYGEAAVGAAINYVSKEPLPVFGGDVLMSYGSFGTYRTGIGVSVPINPKLAARIDVTKSGTDGYVVRTGQKLDGASSSIRWTPTSAFTTKIYATYTHDNIGSYYGTPLIGGRIDPRTRQLNYNFQDAFAEARSAWGRVQSDYRLKNGWVIANQFYATTHRQDRRDIRVFTYNANTQRVDVGTYFLSFRNNKLVGEKLMAIGAFNLFGRPGRATVGGEVQRTHTYSGGLSGASVSTVRFSVDPFNPQPIFDPGFPYIPDRDDFVTTKALTGEMMLDVTNRLKVVGGLRTERIDLNLTNIATVPRLNAKTPHDATTGRAGGLFELTAATNVYASYTTAVEPSTTAEGLDLSQSNLGRYNLSPARQWEAGSKTTALRGRMDATVAYFDIEMRDILTNSLINGISTPQQIGKQISHGVELAVIGRPISRLSLAGDIALTHAEFADFTEVVAGRSVSRSGNRPPFVPKVVINFNPSLRLGRFDISSSLRHATDHFTDNANAIHVDGYTVLGAAVSFRPGDGRYRVTLRGRNLTDRLYTTGAAVSSSPTLTLADPRAVDITLSTKF